MRTIFRLAFAAACLASSSKAQVQNPPQLSLRQVATDPASLFEPLPEDLWIPGGHLLSRIRTEQGDKVTVLQPGAGEETVLFTAVHIHNAFAAAGISIDNPDRIRMGFTWRDEKTVRVQRTEGVYLWTLGSELARCVLSLPKEAERIATSPDDGAAVFVVDHQLHLQVGSKPPQRLTSDGSVDLVYAGAAHRQEFGIQDGCWWSPDGKTFAFFREDLSPIAPYPYVDYTTTPPRSVHGRYPMAGGPNSRVQIGICDVASGKIRYLPSQEKDIYWTNATFTPDGTSLLVALVNRGQDRMDLVRFDCADGRRSKVLFTETDEKWIEPEQGPIFVPDGSGRFLWFSPRDGFRQLYLYSAEGELETRVTRGAFDIRSVVGFGPDADAVLVMGSGEDPRQQHLWRAELKGGGPMRRLTKERGHHTCSLSADRRFVHDSFSNLETPGQSQILDLTTGARSQATAVGHRFPVIGKQEFFTVKAEDNTPLYGTVILPPGLDAKAAKRYPALLYVYGGPHSQLVQDRWLGGSSPWLHYMATQGFVVFTLDNRGTDNRGRAFAQKVFRRLSVLEVQDQLAAVGHIRSLPFVDPKRIGVTGWSYGGYMTLKLLTSAPPGTFACGASGAPVTDWRQYETGYTERYMDTPAENPEGYRRASVLPFAKHTQGRLLLIQGTDDKTVMWSQSLAFVDRCIEAGVLLDFMPYPMQEHGIRGRDRIHLQRLLTRFFHEHLRRGQ